MPSPQIGQVLADPEFTSLDAAQKNSALTHLFPILSDPQYKELNENEKRQLLPRLYPDFSKLSDTQQKAFMDGFQKPSLASRVVGGTMASILKLGNPEIGKGIVKTAIGDINNLMSVPFVEKHLSVTGPGGKKESMYDAEQTLYAPSNPQQKVGQTVTRAAELLVPIPGLRGVRAAQDAGILAKTGYAALRGAADVSARVKAQGGNASDAGAGAVFGATTGAMFEALPLGLRGLLSKTARSQYAKVLAPSTVDEKNAVRKILLNGKNDLVSRGVKAATTEGLHRKVQAQTELWGKNLDEAWKNLSPQARIDATPIVNDMAQWLQKRAVLPDTGVVGDLDLWNHGQSQILFFMRNVAPNLADGSPKDIRAFRQMLDRQLHNNNFQINPKTAADEVKEHLVNSIREELNKQLPEIGKIDNEFHFWKSAATMIGRGIVKDTGKESYWKELSGLTTRYGAGIGASAAIGYEVSGHQKQYAMEASIGGALLMATRSTAWRTVSPFIKNRIAEFLASGKGHYAAELAARAVGLHLVKNTRSSKQMREDEKKEQQPLNPYANPEDQPPAQAFQFNKRWAKPGPYVTKLSPQDEQKFKQWVKANKVPWQDTPTADYDMRGYWKALQEGKAKQSYNAWDHTMHFPDKWKTPYSGVFSRESKYATSNAPHWVGDKLVTKKGRLIVDETPKTQSKPINITADGFLDQMFGRPQTAAPPARAAAQ